MQNAPQSKKSPEPVMICPSQLPELKAFTKSVYKSLKALSSNLQISSSMMYELMARSLGYKGNTDLIMRSKAYAHFDKNEPLGQERLSLMSHAFVDQLHASDRKWGGVNISDVMLAFRQAAFHDPSKAITNTELLIEAVNMPTNVINQLIRGDRWDGQFNFFSRVFDTVMLVEKGEASEDWHFKITARYPSESMATNGSIQGRPNYKMPLSTLKETLLPMVSIGRMKFYSEIGERDNQVEHLAGDSPIPPDLAAGSVLSSGFTLQVFLTSIANGGFKPNGDQYSAELIERFNDEMRPLVNSLG